MTGSAKQSIGAAHRKSGLLRRFAPRNDAETYFRILAARKRPSDAQFFRPLRGRGECRVPSAPAAARVVVVNTRVSHHGYTGSPGIPAHDGVNGLFRALPGDRALLSPSPMELPSST